MIMNCSIIAVVIWTYKHNMHTVKTEVYMGH